MWFPKKSRPEGTSKQGHLNTADPEIRRLYLFNFIFCIVITWIGNVYVEMLSLISLFLDRKDVDQWVRYDQSPGYNSKSTGIWYCKQQMSLFDALWPHGFSTAGWTAHKLIGFQHFPHSMQFTPVLTSLSNTSKPNARNKKNYINNIYITQGLNEHYV